MLGLLYIFISLIAGYSAFMLFMGKFLLNEGRKLLFYKKGLNWMYIFPASLISGLLITTWTVYIFSYIASFFTEHAMAIGNIGAVLITIILRYLYFMYRHKKLRTSSKHKFTYIYKSLIKNPFEFVFTGLITLLYALLFFTSFYYKDNNLYVSSGIVGDFEFHIALIRSFSKGLNFPTLYPFFTSDGIGYHFMFQFLCGNLEYLNLRIDYAINLVSLLCIVSFFMLFMCFILLLTKRVYIAITGTIFFLFRSSFAFFDYFKGYKTISEALVNITQQKRWIGSLEYDNWGIWTQNVFMNQRQFCFGLALIFFVLVTFYIYFDKMMNRIRIYNENKNNKSIFHVLFLSKNSWFSSLQVSLYMGIILGLSGWWHSTSILSILVILSVFAIFSTNKLTYLYTSLISIIIFFIQMSFFSSKNSTFSPVIKFSSFYSTDKFLTVAKNFSWVFGIAMIFLLATILFGKLKYKIISLAGMMPLLLGNILQVSIIKPVNHKFFNVTYVFTSIISAVILAKIFDILKNVSPFSKYSSSINKKNIFSSFFHYLIGRFSLASRILIGFFITLSLILTGIIDAFTFTNIYYKNNYSVFSDGIDPISNWIQTNTPKNSIFISRHNIGLNSIPKSGRRLFISHSILALSAGYNTDEREKELKLFFETRDVNYIKEYIKNNNIDFIYVDEPLRNGTKYKIKNEDIILDLSTELYSASDNVKIYRVSHLTVR